MVFFFRAMSDSDQCGPCLNIWWSLLTYSLAHPGPSTESVSQSDQSNVSKIDSANGRDLPFDSENNIGIGVNVNFQFRKVSNDYVLKQLNCISTNKATGLDNIPATLLKLAAP